MTTTVTPAVPDIAQAVENALPELRAGVGGIRFPELRAEGRADWTPDYAIVEAVWYDYDLTSDYFDHDRFQADYEARVRGLLPGIVVGFRWRSQEIEFQRPPAPSNGGGA